MVRAVLLFVLVSSLLLVGCSRSSTVEGVVDHKVVRGVKDDTSYAIVWNKPDDNWAPFIEVDDKDLQAYFPLHGDLVVSEKLENQMKMGTTVKFQASESSGVPKIVRLLE